jgi:hypothetical protein
MPFVMPHLITACPMSAVMSIHWQRACEVTAISLWANMVYI